MTNDPFKKPGALAAMEEALRRQRQIDLILKPESLMGVTQRFEQLSVTSKAYESLRGHTKLFEFIQTPAYMKALEAASSMQRFADIGARVGASGLAVHRVGDWALLSQFAAARVQPFQSLMATDAWAATLSRRMSRIPVDWAVVDGEEESAEAFARLSRLSDLTRAAPTYTDETTEILVEELGEPVAEPTADDETVAGREARYDAAGRERELIAFPPATYTEVLVSAGYLVSFPPPPFVAVEDGLIEPVAYSPETGFLLNSLEANLRELIVAQLRALEGDAWMKRRVPEAVRKAWTAGQEAAKSAGKPVMSPIHYANFMDLADVITSGANWPVFQAMFTSKENLRVGLLRLYGIRNDIAHSRPIGLSDQLIAVAEGAILFRAMGMTVTFGR
ncbi:MAG TPA: hypothetical protein VIO94_13355 [Phenylobacterium sp.]